MKKHLRRIPGVAFSIDVFELKRMDLEHAKQKDPLPLLSHEARGDFLLHHAALSPFAALKPVLTSSRSGRSTTMEPTVL